MHIKPSLIALLGLAIMAEATSVRNVKAMAGAENKTTAAMGSKGDMTKEAKSEAKAFLQPNLIQTGSQIRGFDPADTKDNLTSAASATDDANFINFCEGTQLTNGLVITEGASCNGIPMGKIPAGNRMVSAIFMEPKNGQNIAVNQTFKAQVMISNLNAGSFTNATSTYYSAPQDLDENGMVIGHTHITIQNLGDSMNPSQVPDPEKFVSFKAITDDGNGKGLLSTSIDGGIAEPGNYRVCTLVAAANHQPVIMPLALRGAQDDCVRFTVGGNETRN